MCLPISASARLSTPLALIQNSGPYSDSVGGLTAGADVAVAQAADPVEQFHVPEVARRQDLLDRERRRQKIEGVEAFAGAPDLAGLLVAAAQLDGQVGSELVRDHES